MIKNMTNYKDGWCIPYKITVVFGISEPTITRKLRREMQVADKAKICDVINYISAKKECRLKCGNTLNGQSLKSSKDLFQL